MNEDPQIKARAINMIQGSAGWCCWFLFISQNSDIKTNESVASV